MYSLNPDAARAGDTFGAYITETGKYTGRFTRAQKLVAREKGTHGIGFSFRADDGREARFDLWTKKSDGTELPGLNTLNAMMACLQIRNLRESPVRVKAWDYDQQKEAEQTVPCFPELMNVDIGLLLRAEEYEKFSNGYATGETGWKMGLLGVFQAHTDLMASEVLGRKTKPELLPQVISGALRDKPLRKKSATPASPPPQSAGASFADDDVPF